MTDLYEQFGAMRIDMGNPNTYRGHAQVPFCSQQIPYEMTRGQTQVIVVESQQLSLDGTFPVVM
jgi:hypothetical protein